MVQGFDPVLQIFLVIGLKKIPLREGVDDCKRHGDEERRTRVRTHTTQRLHKTKALQLAGRRIPAAQTKMLPTVQSHLRECLGSSRLSFLKGVDYSIGHKTTTIAFVCCWEAAHPPSIRHTPGQLFRGTERLTVMMIPI